MKLKNVLNVATEIESSGETDQSDNEEDQEVSDKDPLNESFGLKSLLEEDSNKQSQVRTNKLLRLFILHTNHFFRSYCMCPEKYAVVHK